MTNWFIWQMYPNDGTRSEVWDLDGLSNEQRARRATATPIGSPSPTVRLSKRTPGELPDLVTSPVPWVIATPLYDVLVASGARIEFLEAKMERTRKPFWLANPLDTVVGIDEQRSAFNRFPSGHVKKIKRLVFRPLPADTPPLVRLAEYPALTLIRETLRRALEDASQTPGLFIPIDEYRER